jgi:hypothetical protein
MGKHFLYLPFYFACHKRFFGFLPEGVHVEIETSDPGTDKAAYIQMMSESPEHRDYVMAVADPVQVYQSSLGSARRPAILATLVTNGAFWAVNHGAKTSKGLRDLGLFERIIAYGPGTTSYSIAARIARDSGTTTPIADFIEVVEPGGELLLLTDPKKGAKAVALSPDLLWIEEMERNRIASIELPLGQTAEYNDVLVTALLSYEAFVCENPEIVNGIVKGIQKALLMTRLKNPEVIEYAENYFRFGEHAPNAITKAIDSEVFPISVAVAQPHWLHASKAYFEASKGGAGWTKEEEARAYEYYKACVSPYLPIAQAATTTAIEPAKVEHKANWRWPLALIFAAICAGALFGWFPATLLASGAFVTWWLARQPSVSAYPFVFWTFILLAVGGTLAFSAPFVHLLKIPEAEGAELRAGGIAALVGALAMAGVGYGIDYAERRKNRA